jgi:neutral ceramidase
MTLNSPPVFVASVASTGLSLPAWASVSRKPELQVGEGVAEITPPMGIELGGFHRAPGNERRVKGIRQNSFVRALVLEHRGTRVALISLDVAAVGHAMSGRTRKAVAAKSNIPADNIRLCATHTHSTPGFVVLRQWGAISPEYMASVQEQVERAVATAVEDLAPAQISLGKCRVVGGNFNRTTQTWKTDDAFKTDSTHDDRWLDTMLHVLHFKRSGNHNDLLWYHFSAHPVCFADELAGPDFPGMVNELLKGSHNLSPAYLQGHAGDVNPGDGSPWRGNEHDTVSAVYKAITEALENTQPIEVNSLISHRREYGIP